MNEQIKNYLRTHWISMGISLMGSSIVFIIALINIFIAFRVDYFSLKEKVQANTTSNSAIVTSQQQLLQKVTQIDQKVTDQTQEISDIHRWIFSR